MELPRGFMQVGVLPIFAILRSLSAAHLESKIPLPSVFWEPQRIALALKSPPIIILFVLYESTSDSSFKNLSNSRRLMLGGTYAETIYGPQFKPMNRA